MQEQRGLILHIMQGSYEGSISWGKNPASGVSFHFATAKDGRCGQLVDTDVTAWTQVQGNSHWLSVENEDFNTNPLSPQQLENVARIYARGVQVYGWPLQSTDSVNGRGLGWHGMGGVAWGNHPFCPGEPIKAQRPAILARAAQILGGSGPTPEEEDGMHRVRSGAGDGSIYLVPGYAAPSGLMVAFPLDGPKNTTYASVPLYQLPSGVTVGGSGYYDINPQPWQTLNGGGASGPVNLTEEALDAVEDRAFEGAQRAEDA
jgi:hypothetical protein